MTSIEKKIQFGGWDKRRWNEIRPQVSKFWKDEDGVRHQKVSPKHRYPCKSNKGNHTFVIIKETKPGSDSIWHRLFKKVQTIYDLRCTACGKQSWAIGEKELAKRLNAKKNQT